MMKQILFLLFLIPLVIQATPIAIVNAGFETAPITEGQYTVLPGIGDSTGINTLNPAPGWSVSGYAGLWNPAGTTYFDSVPEGTNIAYGESANSSFSQILSSTLLANTVYTLQVEVGRRKDRTFGGYRVQLLAGGNLLLEDNTTKVPASNTFLTSTVSFITASSHAYLGQNLEIRLISLGGQTNFDNVRLDAVTTVPEISSLYLLVFSILLYFLKITFSRL